MLDTAALHRVPVCTRLVVLGPSWVQPTSSVPCPVRGSTDLTTCLECPRYAGLAASDRGADVSCHAGGDQPSAGAPPTAGEVMTRDVFCVGPDVDIEIVAGLLVETGLHAVPVVDGTGCPVGMVSAADLIRVAGRDDSQPSPATKLRRVDDRRSLTARDAMQRFGAGAHAGDSLAAVGTRLMGAGVDRVPVVDDDGRLVGMVTAFDLTRWSAAHVAR